MDIYVLKYRESPPT